MIKWNKHLRINGGYAHGLAMILEDIKCGKYQIVFASAENVLVKPFFFINKKKKKKAHRSTRHGMPVCIKQIVVRKTSSAVVCASKYRFIWKKNRQIN